MMKIGYCLGALAFLGALFLDNVVNREFIQSLEARVEPTNAEQREAIKGLNYDKKPVKLPERKQEKQEKGDVDFDKVAKYIQNEYYSFHKTNLNEGRALFIAKKTYEKAKKYDISYDWALAIQNHEDHFANRTNDKNLKNGCPPSRGFANMNDSTQAYVNRKKKRNGEKIIDIVGKEVLNFPEKQIDDYLWFIRDKMDDYDLASIDVALAKYYNPGMGGKYVDKVNEKRQKIKDILK